MTKQTRLRIAMEAYEDALIRGLCRDGALEVAMGTGIGVDRDDLLRTLGQAVKPAPAKLTIHIKRIYEPPARADGVRVLVDRLWPRGVAKEAAKIDEWFKDLAPSAKLRTWFGHDPKRWPEFQRRYHAELCAQADRVAALSRLARGRTLTLLYAAKDEERNNAMVLRNYLSGLPR